jgi:hypothetical protein
MFDKVVKPAGIESDAIVAEVRPIPAYAKPFTTFDLLNQPLNSSSYPLRYNLPEPLVVLHDAQ